jgi:GH25 family lysozyme M1 (1,4-beta-N-acetylmuramidase)
VDFWQYTGEGTVAGIEVPVDLNLWFTAHPA